MSQKKKSILRLNVFEALSNRPYGMKMVIAYHESTNGTLTSTSDWHWRSGRQCCKPSIWMETVSSPFRPYKALGADEISQHSGVYKHLLLWSLKWQLLDRRHSMLNIIYTKQRQRLLQNEAATALLNGPPIVLKIRSKSALYSSVCHPHWARRVCTRTRRL